ncbi:MAG: hypothetical protein IT427_19700 [Pirellulales bacterium]|nr:hypothetical protein [Pirellulales bacterium]
MEAATVNVTAGHSLGAAIPTALFRRWLVIGLTSLTALAAIVLATRRLEGALIEPLSAAVFIATGIAAVGATILARSLAPTVAQTWLLTVALVLLAWSLSLPHSSSVGLIVLWLAILGEETWAWKPQRIKPIRRIDVAWRHTLAGSPSRRAASPSFVEDEVVDPADVSSDESEPTDWADLGLQQRMNYRRSADGVSIDGWLRAEFLAGQRTITLHAAFCPAFSRPPQVQFELLDGSDCEIRSTQILPWGIRWEVKLDRTAQESTTVVLGFFASESADS